MWPPIAKRRKSTMSNNPLGHVRCSNDSTRETSRSKRLVNSPIICVLLGSVVVRQLDSYPLRGREVHFHRTRQTLPICIPTAGGVQDILSYPRGIFRTPPTSSEFRLNWLSGSRENTKKNPRSRIYAPATMCNRNAT